MAVLETEEGSGGALAKDLLMSSVSERDFEL